MVAVCCDPQDNSDGCDYHGDEQLDVDGVRVILDNLADYGRMGGLWRFGALRLIEVMPGWRCVNDGNVR